MYEQEIEIKCAICGRQEIIVLSQEQVERLKFYYEGEMTVQEALEGVDDIIIDMISSSICSECIHHEEKN